MDKTKYVEEPAEELLLNAEKDVIAVKKLMVGVYYPPDIMYSTICFHATQAVEKYLKSYIIVNGKKAPMIHNLGDLLHIAVSIDASFLEIENECTMLSRFTPAIRYDGSMAITKSDISTTTKCLSKISNFPPVKSMRFPVIKKYGISFSMQSVDEKSPFRNRNLSENLNSKNEKLDPTTER